MNRTPGGIGHSSSRTVCMRILRFGHPPHGLWGSAGVGATGHDVYGDIYTLVAKSENFRTHSCEGAVTYSTGGSVHLMSIRDSPVG